MSEEHKSNLPVIGFIGIGAMGGMIARWLMKAGYPLMTYDIDARKMGQLATEGAMLARDHADLVKRSDIVMTSLPMPEVWVEVAEKHLVPNAKPGQIFIDVGTVSPPDTRRLAEAFKQKGASLIDATVSNASTGNGADGPLFVFIGGDKDVVDKCWHIFEVIGDPEHTVYCGPSGSGQIVKGVNQLAGGLGNAAYLEAIGFGVRAGIAPEIILKAIGGNTGWRAYFSSIAQRIVDGKGNNIAVKHGQLQSYLKEAHLKGFELPIAKAVYEFCKDSPNMMMDANRLSPSFWHELMTRELPKE